MSHPTPTQNVGPPSLSLEWALTVITKSQRQEQEDKIKCREMVEEVKKVQEQVECLRRELERMGKELGKIEGERDAKKKKCERVEKEYEAINGGTTLVEYMKACHQTLREGLSVEIRKGLNTQGGIGDPKGRKRPDYLKPWSGFISEQQKTISRLLKSYPLENAPKCFPFSGPKLRGSLASEMDLNIVLKTAVLDPAMEILDHIGTIEGVQEEFSLYERISFLNHDILISDRAPTSTLNPTDSTSTKPDSSRLKPDWKCFHVDNLGLCRDCLYVIELKPPHKLTLKRLLRGLKDMDVGSVSRLSTILTGGGKSLQQQAEIMVAEAVTQTFEYMIDNRVEFGLLITGEVFVFLKVDLQNPRTVYFHLVDIMDNVDIQKAGPRGGPYVRLTAVNQVLAITLRALESRRAQPSSDINIEVQELPLWGADFESEENPKKRGRGGAGGWRPNPKRSRKDKDDDGDGGDNQDCERGPKNRQSDGGDSGIQSGSSGNDSVSGKSNSSFVPDSRSLSGGDPRETQLSYQPSSPIQSQRRQHTYCTHPCLLGLTRGLAPDQLCPNLTLRQLPDPSAASHAISGSTFLQFLRKQLEQNPGNGCSPLGLHGPSKISKLMLTAYGCTIIGKGATATNASRLLHEQNVYDRLSPIQGKHIPVCLGNFSLARPHSDADSQIKHFLLPSFVGKPSFYGFSQHQNLTPPISLVLPLTAAIHEVHKARVIHHGVQNTNTLWSDETASFMLVGFQQSKIIALKGKPIHPRLFYVKHHSKSKVPKPKRDPKRRFRTEGDIVQRKSRDSEPARVIREMASEHRTAESITSAVLINGGTTPNAETAG